MRHGLELIIIFSYFILVVASVRRLRSLQISGYLMLAIAHLMIFLIDFFEII